MDKSNTQSMEGQTAIVTGGAQGFGFAIAEQLASQGAKIVIWDIDEKTMQQAAEKLGNNTSTYKVDVANWESVSDACQKTNQDVGQIHALINNAGIAGMNATVVDYPIEEWQKVISVDLDSVFFCCKAVVPLMRKENYGRIVNVASIAGKEGNPNASAYSAAKAGVIALTKSLGKENCDLDIAINCVTPSAAKTRIFDQMSEEHIAYMLAKIPRGRFVKVSELASLIGWLVSPANSYATGAVYDMSGGRATY